MTLLAMFTDPATQSAIQLGGATALGWLLKKTMQIEHRLTRIETHMGIKSNDETE